jgi:manganese/zinc/iron transport system permease protein
MSVANVINALEIAEISARSLEFFSFKYAFVARALTASILVGGLCGAVGTFLVLRRLSLMGDAAGHSTLPGICVAFLLAGSVSTLPIMAGALVSALLAAIAVGVITRGPRSRSDAAIGIVLSVFFGAGIVLLSYIQRVATTSYAGLDAMLLGNVAGISPEQLIVLGVVTVLLGGATLLYLRPLSISTFDPGFAASVGIPVRAIHYGLLGALSLSVVVSVQAVGVVLVSAMLIIPGASAVYWFKRMPGVLAAAVGIGALSGALGAWISYLFEGVSTGPAMVLVATTFFLSSLAFGPRGGLLWRAVRRRRRQRAMLANVSVSATGVR